LTPRSWIITGSLHMALAVILGAFAAHALKSVLDEYSTDIYKTSNYYHFIHSLALSLLGWSYFQAVYIPLPSQV